jgi:hypothetical protein
MRPMPNEGSITFGVYSRTGHEVNGFRDDCKFELTGLFECFAFNGHKIWGELKFLAIHGYNSRTGAGGNEVGTIEWYFSTYP